MFVFFFLSALFSSAFFSLLSSYWIAPLRITLHQVVLTAAVFSQVSGLMLNFFSEAFRVGVWGFLVGVYGVFSRVAP